GGAWWTGERGVLDAVRTVLPGRTALAWAVHASPLLVLVPGTRRPWPLLGLAAFVLLPPDVPAWVLGGVALALRARTSLPVLAVALTVGVLEHRSRVHAVEADQHVVAAVAAALGPRDGLVAPFTWGARISVAATG